MSPPKRKQPQTTVWLQPRTAPKASASFQNRVLAYAGAKDAVQKLTNAGFVEDLLWRHLWGLAWLKKAAGNQPAPWYALPDIPPHTLRRFPARLRRMADEIERLEEKIRSDKRYGPTVHFLPLFLAGAIPGAETELRIGGDVLREVGTGRGPFRQPARVICCTSWVNSPSWPNSPSCCGSIQTTSRSCPG